MALSLRNDFYQSWKSGSSPVDWCEENYSVSKNIAEFYNTMSNILFFLGPPLLIHLFKDYGKFVSKGIHIVWFLLFIVGVSSVIFHATLSLIGQLLDELAILWVYAITMVFFCPRRYLPEYFKDQFRFATFMISATLVACVLSIYNPLINAFALMLLSVPTVYLLCAELERVKYQDSRVFSLGIRTLVLLVLAIVSWVNDRLFCDFLTSIRVTYLHAVWHILIFLSSYSLCVLFAYFFVETEKPNKVSYKLKYWPRNDYQFIGIPYIAINHQKQLND